MESLNNNEEFFEKNNYIFENIENMNKFYKLMKEFGEEKSKKNSKDIKNEMHYKFNCEDNTEYSFLCRSLTIKDYIHLLKNEIKILNNSILYKFKEDKDYFNFYNQFSTKSEVSILNLQDEKDLDIKYLQYYPGIRIYLDNEKIMSLKNEKYFIRNYVKLDLNIIKYIIFPNRKVYNFCENCMNTNLKKKSIILNIENKIMVKEYIYMCNYNVYRRNNK
ncbi:hypothetical protein UT300019_14230 [Clostridium sp. CTA-19]